MTVWHFLLFVGLLFALASMYLMLARSGLLLKKERTRLSLSWSFKGVLYILFGVVALGGFFIWIIVQILGRLSGSR